MGRSCPIGLNSVHLTMLRVVDCCIAIVVSVCCAVFAPMAVAWRQIDNRRKK
jgi:hypothetical protein